VRAAKRLETFHIFDAARKGSALAWPKIILTGLYGIINVVDAKRLQGRTMTDVLTCALSDGVARIAMDDGKVNVMSLAMLQALSAAFDQAQHDAAVVILQSTRPGLFTAGFDLKVFAAGDAAGSVAMVRAGADLVLKLLAFPLPVIGVTAGHAYPMGAFLLLASDLRIGAEGNWRIGFNEVAIGIPVPSFALELGRHRLHPAWLSRSATTGEMFGPADALAAGFIDRLVPAADLDAAVAAAAGALKKVHAPSHATVKQRLRGRLIETIRAAADAELVLDAYERTAGSRSSVVLPRAG
jgi:enoyl-CoA hydratase